MSYLDDTARSWQSNSRFRVFIQERPLVAAGLGLAIGAALAGLLPTTRTENEMLGTTSDEMKRRGRAFAKEEAESLKGAANRTFDTAKDSATHVADTAVAAAEEQGYPAGTLRSEHRRADDGSKTERPPASALD